MELIKVETTTLVNAELRDELTICNNLFANIKGNQKQIALSLGKVIANELYTADFEKLSDFLRYIGLNKSTASQFKKFVEYTTEDLRESAFSYSQIVEMFPLADNGFYNPLSVSVTNFLEINESMPCREIREIVKDFINNDVEAEAEADAEAEDEAETEEAEAETEEVIDYSFYIDYLTSLEVGMELTKDDVKILKQIAKELR